MAKRKSRKAAWAEGGSVDAQMEAMMSEGVDPVSGNEVPTGALPHEVRDDVDAKLSEGEYVVPADVVRYFGVSFFEDLRDKAKAGWQEMESNGRVGGEPVGMEMADDELPFDLAELNIVEDGMDEQPEMYNGGMVKKYAEGGDVTYDLPPELQEVATMKNPYGPTTSASEFKTFKNEAGMTLVVRFVDGKPIGYIPPGYSEVGSVAEEVPETKPEPDGGPDPSDTTSDTTATTGETPSLGDVVSFGLGLTAPGMAANAIDGLAGLLGVDPPDILGQIANAIDGTEDDSEDENQGFFASIAEALGFSKDNEDTTSTNKGGSNQGGQQGNNNNNSPDVDTSTAAQQASDLGFGTVSGGEFGGMGPGGTSPGSGSNADSAGPSGVSGTSDGEAGQGTDNSGAGDQGMGSGWGGM